MSVGETRIAFEALRSSLCVFEALIHTLKVLTARSASVDGLPNPDAYARSSHINAVAALIECGRLNLRQVALKLWERVLESMLHL